MELLTTPTWSMIDMNLAQKRFREAETVRLILLEKEIDQVAIRESRSASGVASATHQSWKVPHESQHKISIQRLDWLQKNLIEWKCGRKEKGNGIIASSTPGRCKAKTT